eukprot:gene1120-655_t
MLLLFLALTAHRVVRPTKEKIDSLQQYDEATLTVAQQTLLFFALAAVLRVNDQRALRDELLHV